MEKPLVSIIIPVYNIEQYLNECLDSILNQTYSNYEIILVDDGSTDSSLKICNEYANKDSRIKVYHQENQGCGPARNTGLKYANGDYIAFIDGDDFIPPNYLEVLVNKSNGKDIVYVKFYYKDQKSKTKNKDRIIPKAKYYKHYFKSKYIIVAWGKLIPKEYLKDANFFPGFFEDLPAMYKVIFKADKLIECSETYYIYRVRENSLMTTNNVEKYLSVIDKLEIIEKDFPNYIKSKHKMNYFYWYKLRLYFLFYKLSTNSINQEVIQYRERVAVYLRKNALRFMFVKLDWQVKCALLLFLISPNLYFKVNNLRLYIKRYLFHKKGVVIVRKKKKKN